MSTEAGQPTIHTVRRADAQPTPLGEVGMQRVLLGEPQSQGSPLLMGVTLIRAGQTSPLIQHDTAEVAYVLHGAGWVVTDTSDHPFAPGDAVLIDAGCWHAIRAGDAPVEMLYVFPTPTTPVTREYRSQLP